MSLAGQSAKLAAIGAAAQFTLRDKPDVLSVLTSLLAISKTNEKERNKLAHWTWGECPHNPDTFLLADPRDGLDRDYMLVYDEQDFRSSLPQTIGFAGMSYA
jgi:hypothetical protein